MKILMRANCCCRRWALGAVMMAESTRLTKVDHVAIAFAAAHPPSEPSPYARSSPESRETAGSGPALGVRSRIAIVAQSVYNKRAYDLKFAQTRDGERDTIDLHDVARQLSPSILYSARAFRAPAVMTHRDSALIASRTDAPW
jgi:hypothetical protein